MSLGTLGDAALNYAKRGFAVFPLHHVLFRAEDDGRPTCSCGKADCKSIGKHPRTPTGLKEATTNVDKIRAWWRKWPTANIGVATGAPSNLYVIDQDDGGELTIRLLEERFTAFPETLRIRTGSGGIHWYFRPPPHIFLRNTQGDAKNGLGPKVDTRGDGGYVVAPPSNHRSGSTYRVEVDAGPAELPLWVGEYLQERTAAPKRVETLRTDPKPAGDADPAIADAYYVCHADVVEGGSVSRHNALRSLSYRLAMAGVKEETIHKIVQRANALHCLPPKEPDEVTKLVDSALIKEDIRAARAAPPEPNVDKKTPEGKAAIRAWKADLKNYGERTATQAMFAVLPAYFSDMRLDPDRAVIDARWHGGDRGTPAITLPIGGDVRELQTAAVKQGLGNLSFFAKRAHDDATEKLLLMVLQEIAPRLPVRDTSSEDGYPVQLVRALRTLEVYVRARDDIGREFSNEERTTLVEAFDKSHALGFVVAMKQGVGMGLENEHRILAVNFDRLASVSWLPAPFRGMPVADLRKHFRAAPGYIEASRGLRTRWLRNAAEIRWHGVDLTIFDRLTNPPEGASAPTPAGGTDAADVEHFDPETGEILSAQNSVPSVPTRTNEPVPSGFRGDVAGDGDRPQRPHGPVPVPTSGDAPASPRPHERPHGNTEKYRDSA